MTETLILGSGSPRRLELLSLLIDRERIQVVRPECDELDFADANTQEIGERLEANVLRKLDDVVKRIDDPAPIILCADTIVIVSDGTRHRALGKPDGPGWQDRVTDWFRQYYCQGPHWVRTGFTITRGKRPTAEVVSGVVETLVHFRDDAMDLLPWYLSTGESLGKAGGYAIQGAGSVFVQKVEGSPSNVIGLPLEAVLDTLVSWKFPLKTE